MIKPFSLRDLRLLGQLQKKGVSLCPIEALTQPRPPLWAAITSLLPFAESHSFTFVLDEQRRDGRQLQGFIQAVHPAPLCRAYLLQVNPRLDEDEDAPTVWNRLTGHTVTVAAELGIERVFACAGDRSPEHEALLQAGFNSYTREEIYRLSPDAHPQAAAQNGIRPEQATDQWGIGQLYRAITPHLVQRAELPAADAELEWLCSPMSWSQGEGLILEDRAGIAGYGHLTPGRVGHWLHLLVHRRAYASVGPLLDYALALLNYYPPYPVYCAVREYQGGIRAQLEDRGFERTDVQCCMVRHTTARVTEAARSLVPGLETRAEAPTTTVSTSERSIE